MFCFVGMFCFFFVGFVVFCLCFVWLFVFVVLMFVVGEVCFVDDLEGLVVELGLRGGMGLGIVGRRYFFVVDLYLWWCFGCSVIVGVCVVCFLYLGLDGGGGGGYW